MTAFSERASGRRPRGGNRKDEWTRRPRRRNAGQLWADQGFAMIKPNCWRFDCFGDITFIVKPSAVGMIAVCDALDDREVFGWSPDPATVKARLLDMADQIIADLAQQAEIDAALEDWLTANLPETSESVEVGGMEYGLSQGGF